MNYIHHLIMSALLFIGASTTAQNASTENYIRNYFQLKLDDISKIMHDDIAWSDPTWQEVSSENISSVDGKDNVIEHLKNVTKDLSNIDYTIEHSFQSGNISVYEGILTYTWTNKSGKQFNFSIREVSVLKTQNNKIIQHTDYGDYNSWRKQYQAQLATINQTKVDRIHALVGSSEKSLTPFSGSILVAKDEHIIYKGAFGYADLDRKIKNSVDSKYFIGSITKQFMTVAILQLVEQGKISLQDKLGKWIPEIPKSDRITIHHLLSHQSGLRRDSHQGYDENVSQLERVLSVKDDTLLFEPGTQSVYSSVGFYALTYILEQVSEMTFDDYFQRYIFYPANMKNTNVRKNKSEEIKGLSKGIFKATDQFGIDDFAHATYFDSYSLGGGGSLFSTIDDMYKFHMALESGTLLSKGSIDLMKKRWPLEEEPRPFNTYGWEVWDYMNSKDPMLIYGFSGRIYGYKSMHRYYQKDNIVIIILTNSEFSERSVLGHTIRNILMDKEYTAPKPAPKKIPLTETMKKHVGVYDFPSEKTTVKIQIVNGKMTLVSHGDNPMYIYPSDENTFYSDLIPLRITFEPTSSDLTQKLEFNFENEFIRTIQRLE